jgi:hypothetical protein
MEDAVNISIRQIQVNNVNLDFKLSDITWVKGAPNVITKDFYTVLNDYIGII